MYCKLFGKYVSDAECNYCDKRSGFEVGSWKEFCMRFESHPLIDSVKWYLKPEALKFKLFICIRWITRRLPLKKRFMIWFDKDGLHLGFWKPNLEWIEPLEFTKEGLDFVFGLIENDS